MSLYDKMLCTGPSGCGHPRHEHTGNHVKDSRSACRHRLARGRGVCSCTRFKEVRGASSVSAGGAQTPDG